MRQFLVNREEGTEIGVTFERNVEIFGRLRGFCEYSIVLDVSNTPSALLNNPTYTERPEVVNVILELISFENEVLWVHRVRSIRERFVLPDDVVDEIQLCEEYYRPFPGGVNNAVRWRVFAPIGLRFDMTRRPAKYIRSLIEIVS